MALADHITDSTKLREEEIEAIISDYVKYDPDNATIVLLPKTQGLTAERKILLYLVALRGWQFLPKGNTLSSDATPGDIAKVTGVIAGTVRPTLRALEHNKIVSSRNGRYELPAHNISRVGESIKSADSIITHRIERTTKTIQQTEQNEKKSSVKKVQTVKPVLAEGFKKLLSEKWFQGGKTMQELKERLDQLAIIAPSSQLPFHLLKACRDGKLSRKKEDVNGKSVWVYSNPE